MHQVASFLIATFQVEFGSGMSLLLPTSIKVLNASFFLAVKVHGSVEV